MRPSQAAAPPRFGTAAGGSFRAPVPRTTIHKPVSLHGHVTSVGDQQLRRIRPQLAAAQRNSRRTLTSFSDVFTAVVYGYPGRVLDSTREGPFSHALPFG
jgi:hypothetical protein